MSRDFQMSIKKSIHKPTALFSDSEVLARNTSVCTSLPESYQQVRLFLLSYQYSKDTYNTYRREVERYCQWVWFMKKQDLCDIDRHSFLEYIDFFHQPPPSWVARQHYPRMKCVGGEMQPNDDWRPFVSKGERKQASQPAVKSMLACLSTFYTFLLHEGVVLQNPIQMLNQKRQLIGIVKGHKIKRRLSQVQWNYMVDQIRVLADNQPRFERHLYIMSLFFLLGLRISEIATIDKQTKTMNLFYQDKERRWWFEAHGKGNKQRDVAVPDAMIESLERFRMSIGLFPMPMPTELTPLVPKEKGAGGLGARQIRFLMREVFDIAIALLKKDGLQSEADALNQATVHWLRHTAISEDVLHRPFEDVRDDVGHENIATTSLYVDVVDAKRHASAKHKKLKIDD